MVRYRFKQNSSLGSSSVSSSRGIVIKVFVCGEVLQPSQPNGFISSAVRLPNHNFTGQA